MAKIALSLEYDGSRYYGWQRQANVLSIQAVVEKALEEVANHPVQTIVAGRTDAGVHATAQVLHFETQELRNPRAWVYGSNSILPSDVRILWAKSVPDTFNARRSATLRRYRYLLYNHPIRPSLLKGQVGWYYRKLNCEAMIEAAQYWLGEHDFSSFRAAGCQSKSPIRCLKELSITLQDEVLVIDVAANAFLHHMVRNMVGSLMMVGTGFKSPLWAKEVLRARDRRLAGYTAPASGLYLVSVEYPESFALPKIDKLGPWFLGLERKR